MNQTAAIILCFIMSIFLLQDLTAQELPSKEELRELIWSNYLLNEVKEVDQCVIGGSLYHINYYDNTPSLSSAGGIDLIHTKLIGDLNGDSINDFIVGFGMSFGGNAVYQYYCTFFSVEGRWVYFGIQSTGNLYFDQLEKNILYGEEVKLDDNDARCCPSLSRSVTYKWEDKKLVLVSESEWIKETYE